jgi:hypothetical protein
MMDESIFEGMKGINGYLGAAISNFTGELLVSDASKLGGNLKEASLTFNESFRALHTIGKKLSLGNTISMESEMEKATVIMICSGEDARMHLHAFAIFKKDGSVALAKMELKKILDNAVESLS